MSRPHPFDLIGTALGEAWFAEVDASVQTASCDPSDRLAFQRLEPVQRVLRELHPADAEAPGAVVEEYGTLLFVVYHYRRAGGRSLVLDRAALERALAGAPATPPPVPAAIGACYLQLPERWFWAQITPGTPAEPVDGLFIAEAAAGRELVVLAVLGLRPEREGFSQIAVAALRGDVAAAARLVRRPLFAPVLEGGERAGVKSLVSEAELLHLTHLALAQAAR
jgi:hypothetical protein